MTSADTNLTVAIRFAVISPVSEDVGDVLLFLHYVGYVRGPAVVVCISFPNSVTKVIIWNVDSISVAKDIKSVNSITSTIAGRILGFL